MAVNITVGQAPNAFQRAAVLEPVATFLGDHVASVQLAGSSPTSNGQVQPQLIRPKGEVAICEKAEIRAKGFHWCSTWYWSPSNDLMMGSNTK